MVEEEQVVEETEATEEEAPAPEENVEAAPEESEASDGTKTLLSDDEGDGADGVPEEYEFTPPEDFDLSEEAQSKVETFKDAAREMKLSQDQFQALVEYEARATAQAQVDQANAYISRVNSWADDVRADTELGGENLQSNLAVIKKVTDEFGDSSLKSLIDAPGPENVDGLGLGNNLAFLRFVYRVGKSITDAPLIEGDGHKTNSEDTLQRMYPSMFSEQPPS